MPGRLLVATWKTPVGINIYNANLSISVMAGDSQSAHVRTRRLRDRITSAEKMWKKFGRAGVVRPTSRIFGEILKFCFEFGSRRFTLAPSLPPRNFVTFRSWLDELPNVLLSVLRLIFTDI